MYLEFVKKFLKYFNITSSIFDRCDLPYDTNTIELSNIATRLTKEIKYYNSVIYKNAFSSQASDALQTIIKQAAAAYKSQIEDLLVTNIYKLSYDQTENLLQSFGFPKTSYPIYVKKQLLKILVENYKSKGTLKSSDLIKAVIPNYNIYELFFVNDDPTFQTEATYTTIVGDTFEIGLNFPYSTVEDDIYWKMTYDEAVNWDYNYAMSPFYAAINAFDLQANLRAIIKLRKLAKLDLDAYNQDPSSYDNRKIVSVDPFPAQMSYLDIYLFLQYIFLKKNNLFNITNASTSYMYQKDLDTFDDDFYKDFLEKQTLVKQQHFTVNVEDIKLDKTWTVLNPAADRQYTFKNIDLGLTYDESIISDGNHIIVYYRDNDDYKIKIIDSYDPTKFSEIVVGIKLIKPAIFYSNGKIVLVGGYNLNGSKNLNRYVIDFKSLSVSTYPIELTSWIGDPVQVFLNDKVYVLSRSGSCKGSLYQYTLEGIPQKLVLQIDDMTYDLDTVRLVPYQQNKVIVIVWNSISNSAKLLLVDEQIDHIITDISCLLYNQLDKNYTSSLFSALRSGEFFALCYNDILYVYYENKIIKLNLSLEKSEVKDYIVPKSISKLLIPTYINNKILDKYKLPPTVFSIKNNMINLQVDDLRIWYNWPFSKLCDECSILPKYNYLIKLGEEVGIITKPSAETSSLTYVPYSSNNTYLLDGPIIDTSETVEISNYQFCEFKYDDNILYDRLIVQIPYDDIVFNDCNIRYDKWVVYDKRDQFEYELNCFLPSYSDYTNIYPNNLESFYYKESLPEKISVSFVSQDIMTYNSSYSFPIYTGDFNDPAQFFIFKEGDSLKITLVDPEDIHDSYLSELNVTYDCSVNQDSPLCFILNRLNDRKVNFEETSNSLFITNKIDELHNFIMQLNHDNMEFLDSVSDYTTEFYSLLYVVSKLTDGANLVPLFSDIVDPVKDLVLPIQSRPLFEGVMIVSDDPIGDYVGLSDDITLTHIKTLYSALKTSDQFFQSYINKPNENLSLSEVSKHSIEKTIIDQLLIYDIYDNQRHSTYTSLDKLLDSYLSTITQEQPDLLYLSDESCVTDFSKCTYDSNRQYDRYNSIRLCDYCK